jgi:hypothetical protein
VTKISENAVISAFEGAWDRSSRGDQKCDLELSKKCENNEDVHF